VAGGCGNATSSEATLTMASCSAATLLNSSFELGNISGLATNWTSYQRTPYPTTTAYSIQMASPPSGAGTNYQQIANTSSTGGGGVRQDITGCTIGASYTIAGWMRGNSALYSTCTVKVSPATSTTWSTAVDLNPAATYTGTTWTSFSGTVVATATSMTLWLDGQTGSTGQNKAECFDGITVTCTGGQGQGIVILPTPLQFTSVAMLPDNQVQLVLVGELGASVTIYRSGDLMTWTSLTNVINTGGTLEFTDSLSADEPQRFYRATTP
jgi:hypothetical protein